MKEAFWDALGKRVLLADGGMGSAVYARGFFVNQCYDELNLSQPATILDIHREFAKAGAEILTTNTFGANRIQLEGFGLSDKWEEINRRGVELARETADGKLYVAGCLGPVPRAEERQVDSRRIAEALGEQARVLADSGVDLIKLESFPTLEQLQMAYAAVTKAAPGVPIWLSLLGQGLGGNGLSPERYTEVVKGWGARLAGVDGWGAPEILDMIPGLALGAGDAVKLAVLPSAGRPELVEGRLLYLASPEYLAEYARRCVQKGVAIIGGSGGVTPAMIREMDSFLRSIQPRKVITVISEPVPEPTVEESLPPIPIAERSPFGRMLGRKFAISVELDPPKGVDATKSVQGAKFLYENGIDVINIADGPRATGRMSPIALSALVKREVPIDTIIHVCARDRNLLALQMDLISANAMGIRNLMLITGDPPKMGMYPDATAVFDVDSIGLVVNCNRLNRGLDFACRPLQGQTGFVIGVGCNPGAADLDREAERYEQKVMAGAEYVFSQPIYDNGLLEKFLDKIKHVKPIPFFVGILPLVSYKNAEFFNNNVPGMQVPPEIMKRLARHATKEKQQEEGIAIATEALIDARSQPMVKGAYIFPAFGRYDRILTMLEKAGVR
ncbi:MAG: bifunctional homocysteine S-methyltransferase/methylenetetrahydrofolate reductase [bacterium]